MDGPSFKPSIQKSCVRAWLRQDSPRRGPPRGAPHRSHIGRVGTVYLKGRLSGDRGWLRAVEGRSTLPSLQQRSIPSTPVWRHRRLSWGRTSSVHSFLALAARGEPMHMRPAVGAGTLRTAIRPPTGLSREPATWTKDRSGPSSRTVTSRLCSRPVMRYKRLTKIGNWPGTNGATILKTKKSTVLALL